MVARILGPDGQPIETQVLSSEVAVAKAYGRRNIVFEHQATGLTPERLAQILRDAAQGHNRAYLTLAQEMEERYAHYASQLQTRKLAFDAIEESLEAPEGVPSKIMDAVQRLIHDTAFREMCSALTDAIAKGYAVVEPIWDYTNGLLMPVAYKERDPRFFQFDQETLSTLRLVSDTNLDGEPLQAAKFIIHLPHTRSGLPVRRGLARPAAWAFLMQSFTLQDWAGFAEVYGIPFRVGKYTAAATEDDRRTLLRAVRDISSDAAAIIPTGMEIEFHETTGNQGEKIFGELISYLDRQISKLVVGQTMTADDGSSLGQAKIHNEVRLDILRADCRQMSATINRDLLRWFVAMNFGPQEVYPSVEFPVAEPEDIKALGETLSKLVPLGLKVGQRQIREKMGLSEPETDEELLQPASTTPEASSKNSKLVSSLSLRHHRHCTCATCSDTARLAASEPDPDALDALIASEDFEAITDPLLDEVFALAAEASSYEEVLRKLDRLRLDSGPLRERLARSTAKARGLGDVRDVDP